MRAKRSLGQNFLRDPNIQRRIIAALEADATDEILEIGPGEGALTRHLAGRVRRLVAVELDDRLSEALRREFEAEPGVEVLHADILDVALESVTADPGRLKVVGNIPYNITTPILFHLLERRPRPERIVVMVQREVADRILAQPGPKMYGALSVGIRAVADAQRLFNVGRRAFRPVPDVDSAVLLIRPHDPPRLDPADEAELRRLTRAAFGWRRKQLQRTLRDSPHYRLDPTMLARVLDSAGIDPAARPETLSPAAFIRLARALHLAQ